MYEASDCFQFGTLALVLCQKGYPKWTLALSKSSQINNQDLLNNQAELLLVSVPMDKTEVLRMKNTQPGVVTPEVEQTPSIETESFEQRVIQLMWSTLQKDPKLETNQLPESTIKVASDSTDYVWLACKVLEQASISRRVNGVDHWVQSYLFS